MTATPNLSKAARDGAAERIAYGVAEAASAVGVSPRKLYSEMAEGRLRFRKVGDRRLILRDELLAWLAQGMEAA